MGTMADLPTVDKIVPKSIVSDAHTVTKHNAPTFLRILHIIGVQNVRAQITGPSTWPTFAEEWDSTKRLTVQ